MLIISLISLIVSVLLQIITSNIFNYSFLNMSFLYTMYPIITFIVLLPFFNNRKKYITLLIVFGIIIDITFTNTLILNTLIFIIIYLFNSYFFKILPYNLLMTNISSVISLVIYHMLSFLLLLILSVDRYNIVMLFKAIIYSMFMTIIYTSILYLIINYINSKFELREIR